MILFCHVGKWLVYNGNRKTVTMEVMIMSNRNIENNRISDNDLELVTGGTGSSEYEKIADMINRPKRNLGENDKVLALKGVGGDNQDQGRGMSS